jgi:hypothetical protein
MINYRQFEDLTGEILVEMDASSLEALKAIMMIVAHESHGGTYIKQIKGPALGVIQMEPATHESLWTHADSIRVNAIKCQVVKDVNALRWDLKYNIFMARSMLLTDPQPLPTTDLGLSRYLKDFYNTASGKARPTDYLNAYLDWRNT